MYECMNVWIVAGYNAGWMLLSILLSPSAWDEAYPVPCLEPEFRDMRPDIGLFKGLLAEPFELGLSWASMYREIPLTTKISCPRYPPSTVIYLVSTIPAASTSRMSYAGLLRIPSTTAPCVTELVLIHSFKAPMFLSLRLKAFLIARCSLA